MKTTLAAAVTLLSMLCAVAQRPASLVYYDVDRLYDTLPALFYDDSDFMPEGRMHWTSERYRLKIAHTAALLDSMAMDLAVISGIETEAAVRDLAEACNEEYAYFHRTLNTYDGLDIALLYHGDRFVPMFAQEGRGWLYIEGRMDGVRIGLLLCRNTRYADAALVACIAEHPYAKIIAAGRYSAKAAVRVGMDDALARAERAGRGNMHYTTGWKMGDRIVADTSLHAHAGDVYARRWLIDAQGAPHPTYWRNNYRGGYSRSLPVFVYFSVGK